jgi:hypothetical protein
MRTGNRYIVWLLMATTLGAPAYAGEPVPARPLIMPPMAAQTLAAWWILSFPQTLVPQVTVPPVFTPGVGVPPSLTPSSMMGQVTIPSTAMAQIDAPSEMREGVSFPQVWIPPVGIPRWPVPSYPDEQRMWEGGGQEGLAVVYPSPYGFPVIIPVRPSSTPDPGLQSVREPVREAPARSAAPKIIERVGDDYVERRIESSAVQPATPPGLSPAEPGR